MDSPDLLTEARNEVFILIGKLTLNFQKIEKLLKALIQERSVSLELHENGCQKITQEKTSQHTLGKLIHTFINDNTSESNSDESELASHIKAKFTFSFDTKQMQDNETEAILKKLLADRNNLIHQFGDKYPLNNIESCQEALADLKSRYENARVQFDYFNKLIQLLNESRQDLVAQINSADFESLIVSSDDEETDNLRKLN
jgi:hypothetical protein